MRRQNYFWSPSTLSQSVMHSEGIWHAQEEILAASKATLLQKWASGIKSSGVYFRSFFPRFIFPPSPWDCRGYFDTLSTCPVFITNQALIPQSLIYQSWVLVADSSQSSPSLGIVLYWGKSPHPESHNPSQDSTCLLNGQYKTIKVLATLPQLRTVLQVIQALKSFMGPVRPLLWLYLSPTPFST